MANHDQKRTEPPADICRELRQEVGFGCPVEGCRKPFLEFHHFDPVWAGNYQHIQEGMIALCNEHHTQADQGVWSKEQLRAYKNSPTSVEEIRAKFNWVRPRQLIRIGSNYCDIPPRRILADGQTASVNMLSLMNPGIDEAIDMQIGAEAMMNLSFSLVDQTGSQLALMDRNSLTAYPANFEELVCNASATRGCYGLHALKTGAA